jgi:DNA helicase-2/ATP-dependent DNA helicase PcrA
MPNQTNSSRHRQLNQKQRKAATHGIKDGVATQHRPLLIIAGAGTGKTETLGVRIGELVACGAKPSQMFVASFTRRASNELVERAQAKVGGGASVRLPYAGTFHSIAYKLLCEFGTSVGLSKKFTVLDPDDAASLMDRARAGVVQTDKRKIFPKRDVCCAIHSYCRNACLSLKATLRKRYSGSTAHAKPLAKIFASYADAKRLQNVVDYDDLLEGLALLLRDPTIGRRLRKRFRNVLIDEFQDTNRLQFKIVKLLKPNGRGLTVVGDDAQAIYSFRAATVRNIREFLNVFETSKMISLTRNYRSTVPILKASNAVMSVARGTFKKNLWSMRGSNQRPLLTTVMDEREQAEYVTETILNLRGRGIALRDQAVLIRASQHSLSLEVELARRKIPFQKWGGTKLLESAHVKDFLAVLKWWQNSSDQIAGFRALRLLDGIGKATADRLVQEMSGGGFLEWLPGAKVSRASAVPLKAFGKLLQKLDKSEWPGSLEMTIQWYRRQVERLYDDKVEARLADLDQLVSIGETFGSCHQFLAELALDPPGVRAKHELSKEAAADDVLTLSTIHSAKGCEWKSVTILSVMDGCIPSVKCKNDQEIEEERRLLYVGMTRAQNRLELVLPKRDFQSVGRGIPAAAVYSKPSRFIPKEILRRFKRTTVTSI